MVEREGKGNLVVPRILMSVLRATRTRNAIDYLYRFDATSQLISQLWKTQTILPTDQNSVLESCKGSRVRVVRYECGNRIKLRNVIHDQIRGTAAYRRKTKLRLVSSRDTQDSRRQSTTEQRRERRN